MSSRSHEPQISRRLVPEPGEDATQLHEPECPDCGYCSRENRVLPADLESFVTGILMLHQVPEQQARTTARVLVAADARGIPSHGVARLGRYLGGLRDGYIVAGVEPLIEEPAPALGRVDGRNGLGQVVADAAMNLAIDKASAHGVGVVTVRRSNHFGVAGYYALMAAERGMIGLSLTNSAPLVVPTHAADVRLGTNPIALAAPCGRHPAFLLDMATSVVSRGKLEVHDRNRHQMPHGWAVDEQGYDTRNPGHVLANLKDRLGGGILPLGGRGTRFGGHKGYGLAFMVDLLSGVLSGSSFGPDVHDLARPVPAGEVATPDVGHFFMAIDIARFLPLDDFQARLDDLIDSIHGARRALDAESIYVHGEQSWGRLEESRRNGIALAENIMCTLVDIARQSGHPAPRIQPDREPGA